MTAAEILTTSLAQWTVDDVQRLIGEPESHRLDFKGSRLDFLGDWETSTDKVADAVACFASASGGFLILGAGDGERFDAFRGTRLTAEHLDRLGRSIRSKVEPTPLIIGPRQFFDPKGTDGKEVVVIEVLPNSLGQPSRGPSGFRSRYEAECLKIPLPELERRISMYTSAIDPTFEAVRERQQTLLLRLEPPRIWMLVTAMPVSREDLLSSAAQLRDAALAVEGRVRAAGGEMTRWLPGSSIRTASRGATLDEPSRHVGVNHAGTVDVAINLSRYAREQGTFWPESIAQLAFMSTAYAVGVIRQTRPHTPHIVRLMTIGIPELSTPAHGGGTISVPLDADRVEVEFVTVPASSSVEELTDRVDLLLTRIGEGAGVPFEVKYDRERAIEIVRSVLVADS